MLTKSMTLILCQGSARANPFNRICCVGHILSIENLRTKKSPIIYEYDWANQKRELTMTYSHMAWATLPLAQRCFTSEFGKGSGGAIVLLSSAKGVRYESDVLLIDLSITYPN